MKKINKVVIISLFLAVTMLFVSCIHTTKTPLGEIQNLRIETVSTDKAVILWDSVKGAADYQVKVENISSGNYVYYYLTEEPRFQAEELEFAETYEITVNARPADYDFIKYTDGPQKSISFKTKTPPVPDGEFKRPENLKAVVKDGTVTLSWDSVEGAVFYDIHRESWCDDDSFYWSGIEDTMCVEASETAYTDKLREGTVKVLYKVCARDGEFSNKCYWSEKLHLMLK